MNVRTSRIISALAISLLMVTGLLAQSSTSGAIEGKVVDSSGAPLPGVTVEVRSNQLQGSRTETTDTKGMFRINLLPPGIYTLATSLSGFQRVNQGDIAVGLGKTTSLDIHMSQAASEQITVTAAAPVVDVTSNTTGANITAATMQALPFQRNFSSVAQVTPGVQRDNSDGRNGAATFYGSSGAENQYIIDGLNTTAVRDGTEGKTLNFDFIQEVEVKSGGLPAEYGRMTGGIINAITKSGGNQYNGDLFGYDAPKGLRSDNTSFAKRPGTVSSVLETGKQTLDFGGDLGGYFVKDRLWFFGALDHVERTDTNTRINRDLVVGPPVNYFVPIGGTFDNTDKKNLYAGKLTLRLNDNNNVTLSAFGDPTTNVGPQFLISGPPSTFQGTLKTGGNDAILRYSGIYNTSWVLNGQVGLHNETNKTTGPGETIPNQTDATVVPSVVNGGFGFYQQNTFKRDVAKLDLNKYLTNHDFKIGGDYEHMKGDVNSFDGGAGQRITKRQVTLADGTKRVYYAHRYYINDLAPGFARGTPSSFVIANPLVAQPETKNLSAYAQDSWRIVPNFTLALGARWESQEVIGRGGVTAFKLDKNLAPRLGFTWDVANNGRSKLYANYGRFFEAIPMDINIRAFGGELQCICNNFSPDPANYLQDPTAALPIAQGGVNKRQSLLGGSTEPVDPNLKGQHIDEMIAGYDMEVAPNFAVGVKGTYRKLANVIEDMLIGTTGEYLIANPGSGIGREAAFYTDGSPVVTPPGKRTFKGVELHATKRFSSNTQFFASYLWSKLEGNYDGTFQASTGQLDPNINSAFDYADFIVNNNGLLSSDRTHQLKFDGSYSFSQGALNGLSAGLSTHWASGTPLTAVGYSFAYQNWEYYLTQRGALGRGPSTYEVDAKLSYPIPVGPARLNLVLDVFNLLNLQKKVTLDQRFNRIQDPACTGIDAAICTGDGGLATQPGTVIPLGTVNPANAPNPDFLKAGTQFTAPRTIRLGVRASF